MISNTTKTLDWTLPSLPNRFASISLSKHTLANVFAGLLFCIAAFVAVDNPLAAEELQTFSNCTLVKTEWSDGDSFLVKLEDGKRRTFRLYGVDCVEYHVTDTTDARRLRTQRRYFGIADYGGSAQSSIKAAKQFGADAKAFIERELEQPFTVSTTFADARGDGKHKRYYGFITTNGGDDLGEKLVRMGLARAFGVSRKSPDGKSRDDYRDWLSDVELIAAKKGSGVWAATDWESLPVERQLERDQEAELALATDRQPLASDELLDLNTSPRDDLMRLPGVGEVLANRIIEDRPYKKMSDLKKVEGIGDGKLESMLPHLKQLAE